MTDLEGLIERLREAAAKWDSLQPHAHSPLSAQLMREAADALSSRVRGGEDRANVRRLWRCTGCGSMEGLEQIRAEHPGAISCCPERNMQPTPDNGEDRAKGGER